MMVNCMNSYSLDYGYLDLNYVARTFGFLSQMNVVAWMVTYGGHYLYRHCLHYEMMNERMMPMWNYDSVMS